MIALILVSIHVLSLALPWINGETFAFVPGKALSPIYSLISGITKGYPRSVLLQKLHMEKFQNTSTPELCTILSIVAIAVLLLSFIPFKPIKIFVSLISITTEAYFIYTLLVNYKVQYANLGVGLALNIIVALFNLAVSVFSK